MISVEGYYDPDDYNDPVKYRVNPYYSRYISLYDANYLQLKVQRNVVRMLDGTNSTFYTTKLAAYESSHINFYNFFQMFFSLHHEYIEYDQYVDYRISAKNRRRLDSESSSNNENIMPGYYFMFYIMAQFGGLYTFLHLVIGFFMNKWTEQHLKQTFMNELYRSIEAKDKSRSRALSVQAGRNKTTKVFPNLNASNIGMDMSQNKEQYPLMNEESKNIGAEMNQNDVDNHLNPNYRYQQSQRNQFDYQSVYDRKKSQTSKKSKSFYTLKDVLYGIFYCSK